MEFKVGDEAIVISNSSAWYHGWMGKVVSVSDNPTDRVPVEVQFEICGGKEDPLNLFFAEEELKLVPGE